MKKSIAFSLIFLMLVSAILACNASAPRPTADLARIVAQTETAMAVALALTPSATIAPPSPTQSQPAAAVNPTLSLQTTPGFTPAACTNRARLVSETIPDATQFSIRQQFMKTWVLQNTGTCTWTPEYALAFVNGAQMSGTSPAPIGQTVPPGGSIQIFLPQTAPEALGEHQGFWKLQDTNRVQFGVGDDGATPFWVKINVVAGQPTTAATAVSITGLGAPSSTITFSGNNAPFYLGDDDDIGFSITNNALQMTAFRQSGDQWRVAEVGAYGDFAIEAQFSVGSNCSGKDSYGLLVRAPNKADGVIDSGYVVGFNCDGQYRVYRMDNGGYTGIASWANHSAIKAGPNQSNTMTVIAKGEHLQFYANGILLIEFYDSMYSAGLWGLMIGSGGSREFQARVTQILLWNQP